MLEKIIKLQNLIKSYNNSHIMYDEIRDNVYSVFTIDMFLPIGLKDFVNANFTAIDEQKHYISFKKV